MNSIYEDLYYLVNRGRLMEFWISFGQTNRRCYYSYSTVFFKYGFKEIL